MDTEFHFAAPDRGLPGAGLWPVGDQVQRSRAYVAYVVSGLLHPNMVGTHWFAFADQSAAGRPGENYQIGFVDVTDTPYPAITQASRIMADRMYELRAGDNSDLLPTLESLWTGARGARDGSQPVVSATDFPYRIEQAPGLEVASKNGRHLAHGPGRFKLVLKPCQGEAWNMESVSVLGLLLKNTGTRDLTLDLMLRNDGATGWSNSALGRTIVQAGEEMPLAVALNRSGDYQTTHPAYLRMSGRPNGSFRHWHTFDPGTVKDLVVTSAQDGACSFELARMFPLREMDETRMGAFPFIDQYGQYIHTDWPDKVRSDGDITRHIAAEQELEAELGQPSGLSRYGGWKKGPQREATGFFRTEKVGGRWWFVDPEGYLFWSYGVNCVGIDYAGQTPVERDPAVFRDLPARDDAEFGRFYTKREVEENYRALYDVPHYDFTRANLYRKYGVDWATKQVEQDIRRLKYCGFNTIGAWSDPAVASCKKVPYVAMLHYAYSFAGEKLPDPFDPKTRAGLREAIEDYPVAFADDPWCLGAFVNNELHWQNDSRHLVAEILGYVEEGTDAKKVFRDWLKKKYGTVEALNTSWGTGLGGWDELLRTAGASAFKKADADDCAALVTLFADAFFSMVDEELSAHAPNLLYLGCRMNAASREVLEVAAKYADVISANKYSYRPDPGSFGSVDKPVLISEFHFANTSGSNLGGGLRSAQNALQQGRLLNAYMADAIAHPGIVGVHWYQWRDQSAGGRYDGENYDVGFFDVADIPNADLVRASAACGRTLYSGMKR